MGRFLFPAMALAAATAWPSSARADCIDDAAQRHGVNAHVLRAIGWHESRLRPDAIGHNTNGTTDIGAFQINTLHLARLAPFGINRHTLRDGCVSAHVAAWHYARQVQAHGNTWQAIGAYHSRTPARTAWYANAIATVLMRWGVVPRGALPYDPATALAPRAAAPPAAAARRAASQEASTAIAIHDAPD